MFENTINNPLGLSQQELPMYELFKKTEGREPECMWELMHYSIGIQQKSEQERKFWGEVFGL